jgi:Ca2+-binding RTX toxin-like protein
MWLTLATAAILLIGVLAPGAASATEIQTRQIDLGTLFVTATDDAVNHVAVNWVTSPSGAPDLVIGDTTAGISDPIPSPCARVDAMIARCPASAFDALNMDLGPGKDLVVVVKPAIDVNGFVRMDLDLGPGDDRATDLSAARDVWAGGSGRDRLDSGPGNDLVRGGAANDVIDCGAGKHDVGIGGPGRLDLGRHCEVVHH